MPRKEIGWANEDGKMNMREKKSNCEEILKLIRWNGKEKEPES